jgi:glutathione S-transferase
MLKIYGQARSRTFRVLWLCKESNIAFEHDPVSIHVPDASAKQDWYLKLNPNARVPTIDDDGHVMWESAAINLYLARKYKSPLWPATAQGEGTALQWGFFMHNDVEPPMLAAFHNRVQLPPEKRDAALAADGEARLQPKLAVMEAALTATPYFGGDRWDMSDFIVGSIAYTMTVAKIDLGKYPRFGAWLAASQQRPAFKEAWKYRE